MSYITDKQLEDRLDLPISLPVTELKSNSWLVVATYALQTPMEFQFRFLQLQLISAEVVGGEEGDTETEFSSKLINPSKGLCYCGIYQGYTFENPSSLANIGTLNDLIVADKVGIFSRPTEIPLVISGPAVSQHYSVVVANNTENTNLKLLVNGHLRLDLNAL